LIRFPVRWERLQPRLGEPLDLTELGRLRQVAQWAQAHKAALVPEPHNFGRYALRHKGKVVDVIIDQVLDGARPVTRDHFADFWRRLADNLRDEPAIVAYDLMNEPHDMGDSEWKTISQAAVNAIRAAGDRRLIYVPGNSWSNSMKWVEVNGPTPWIKDPAGNVAYEAHCYFDHDFSGTYVQTFADERARDPEIESRGERRVVPFLKWCQSNSVRGFLGEFGVPNDPGWLRLLVPFLHALDEAKVESCWWAAGEWWGDYKLSLQPRDNFRRPSPQMKAIVHSGPS
jgi:endoglucanase